MHRSLKSCSFLPLFLRTWSYFGNSFRIPRIFQNFCIQRENMLLSDVYKKSRINAWRNVFRELNVGLESRIICRRGFRGTRWGGGRIFHCSENMLKVLWEGGVYPPSPRKSAPDLLLKISEIGKSIKYPDSIFSVNRYDHDRSKWLGIENIGIAGTAQATQIRSGAFAERGKETAQRETSNERTLVDQTIGG